MPEPGSLLGNLGKSVDRVAAAGDRLQAKARDAADQAARNGPENAPGGPSGQPGAVSPTQPGGTRQ